MMPILIIICALLFILLASSAVFFFIAFVRRDEPDIDNPDSEINGFLAPYREVIKEGLDYIAESPKSWVNTVSFDGLKLWARYFDNGSRRTIILFHGYRSSADRDFSCAVKMYCGAGFNVLLVDERSHGKSEGRLITFGVKESRDVASWVNYCLENTSADEIFLSGMSMGATTVLLASGKNLPDSVKGIIADCGFTSPAAIIKKVARQVFHVNASWFLPFMNLYCVVFGHFSICGVSTVKALEKNRIPVLFIHGNSDDFVPCEMSRIGYDSDAGNKELLLIDGAGHGMSYLLDTGRVSGTVLRFLEKYSGS